MALRRVISGLTLAVAFAGESAAQEARRVDFARDIQPLFQEHCVGCHGPSQQSGGLRLDQRSSAMAIRGGTRIGPGNAAGSRLYMKLTGTKYGSRMPPTGPLPVEKIELIKTWIDQGAEWPDSLSGEKPPTPADPKAVRLMTALRDGDRKTFERLLGSAREAVNLRGAGGTTPLMYATLYGDLESLRHLLDRGADPNLANDAGATALMWAVDDADKTRLLLERGAKATAVSNDDRSPLAIALERRNSVTVVKLLLEHGEKLDSLSARNRNALRFAGGDEATLRLLLDKGADAASLSAGLQTAFLENCAACVELLIKSAPKPLLSSVLFSPAQGNVKTLRKLFDAGADGRFTLPGLQFTPLMYAGSSETGPPESVQLLIEHGADVNVKTADGSTALDFALRQGRTEMIDTLKRAGAQEGDTKSPAVPKPKPAQSARAAIDRAIPLLQHADVEFLRKSGCVSCHNNNLTAMTVAAARKSGIAVNEQTAQGQVKTIAAYLESNRERALQGLSIPGGPDTVGYILLGLAAENYAPDAATDAEARFLKGSQRMDGSWRNIGGRPPIEVSDIQCTATAMRALQVYGIRTQRSDYEQAVQLAAKWLANAQPATTEDRAFQLLGMAWSQASHDGIRKAAASLLAAQRPDGGWAQLPTLPSDAYATGQALVALRTSGAATASQAVYKRGAQFLLSNQLEDGSWYVRSRSIPFQPYFESGFPHARDQFISAAATNWATMALIGTLR